MQESTSIQSRERHRPQNFLTVMFLRIEMDEVYGRLLHTAELAQRKVKGIWDLGKI